MTKPFRTNFPITQLFGVNKETYSRFGLQGHNGIDYGMPVGTEIVAPHSGKVLEAYFDATGYGLYLKIENEKEGSVLAHLSEHFVSIGTDVMEGQLIAKSGNTGFSTGPHLHWGWYLKPRDRSNGFNGFQDQLVLMKAIEINYFPKPQDLSGKVSELEQKVKDLLATEDRLKKEKDEVIRQYEERIKTLQSENNKQLADIRVKLLNEVKQKIINLANSLS